MAYTITYIDLAGVMTASNNISEYDPDLLGNVLLSAPSIRYGEFRGWYTDQGYTTRITQLTDSITQDTTIYAYININTQLQILGSSVVNIGSLSGLEGKHMLMTNSLTAIDSGSNARSLSAITPTLFSELVAGSATYIYAANSSVSLNSTSILQEYYIDLGVQESLNISTIADLSGVNYIIIHFTRGIGCTPENVVFYVNVENDGTSLTSGLLSVGSTIVLAKDNGDWVASHYLNPTWSQVAGSLVDDILETRNYVHCDELTFPVLTEGSFGGRNSIDVTLTDLDLSQSSGDIDYKSIIVQFDNSKYSESGADVATLNKQQGYLNLLDVQPATFTYNSATGVSTLKLSYDCVPAFSGSSIVNDIPVRIMVVI